MLGEVLVLYGRKHSTLFHQAANTSLCRKLDEARERLSESESARLQKEEELTSLRGELERWELGPLTHWEPSRGPVVKAR